MLRSVTEARIAKLPSVSKGKIRILLREAERLADWPCLRATGVVLGNKCVTNREIKCSFTFRPSSHTKAGQSVTLELWVWVSTLGRWQRLLSCCHFLSTARRLSIFPVRNVSISAGFQTLHLIGPMDWTKLKIPPGRGG
jgi:hypothetical protein